MTASNFRVRLFYSYSHRDIRYKKQMEKVLKQLKREGDLQSWSDAEIPAGGSISGAISSELPKSHIVAFLLSPDFIASEACYKEWQDANKLVQDGHPVVLLPIILRPCEWQHFTGGDIKALPQDGKPISNYDDEDAAWQEICEEVRRQTEKIRGTHTVKPDFLNGLNTAPVSSTQPMPFDDIYVFPRLAYQYEDTDRDELCEETIESAEQLLSHNRIVVHGKERCGKTTLASHLALTLINNGEPLLLVDLDDDQQRLNERKLRESYSEQFDGDYNVWLRQSDKTIIIDGVSQDPKSLNFISKRLDDFERVVLLTSSDVYYSFLADDVRLADYREYFFKPLTHGQQEQLIRKGLATLDLKSPITDQLVDQAEKRVNSVIVTNKLVPRFPFYVMAILQTLDKANRSEVTVTSYGHCYYILIVINLTRAGISESDESLNAAFNFIEHLARETFEARLAGEDLDFAEFAKRYEERYFVPRYLINRLTDDRFGVLNKSGRFRDLYTYYYFLGKVLANDADFADKHIDYLTNRSFRQGNYLALLFTIHHARDEALIDRIANKTAREFEDVPAAKLDRDETARFSDLLDVIQGRILSERSVEEERADERDRKDSAEEIDEEDIETDSAFDDVDIPGSNTFRVLKNNELLGQVLRNQHGSLERTKIEQIIETVLESALKLINTQLSDEDEIHRLAQKYCAEYPDADKEQILRALRYLSFIWTIFNLNQAADAIDVPNIRDAVVKVVERYGTPAYEVLGYFNEVNSAPALTKETAVSLRRLMDGTTDKFIQGLLSFHTQMYMNTHRSTEAAEQAICAALRIEYSNTRRALAAARAS